MRHCIIIANKGAGSFSEKSLDRICSQMAAGGLSIERRFCSDFAEMTATAADASRTSDSSVVVAAGGDGTINAVFNGLAGNNATCAILPMGTANVMALELGINSPEQAVSRIISGQSRPFTAGLLKNSASSRRFFLMAGIGLDGQIVGGVSPGEKRLLGKGAYVLSAFRSIIAWDSGELHVTTDEDKFSCSTLIACNSARYGGSFSLARPASIFSPSFEVVALKGFSRSEVIRAIAGVAFGGGSTAHVFRTTARLIKIEGVRPVQADGDYWGDSPVEILAESDYARIIV